MSLGSDAGGDAANPFLNIMFAVRYDRNPAEALTRKQALAAYTAGGAFAERQEQEKGRIAVGMKADLALLSQDILTLPLERLPATASLLTIVDGVVIYEDAASLNRCLPHTKHGGLSSLVRFPAFLDAQGCHAITRAPLYVQLGGEWPRSTHCGYRSICIGDAEAPMEPIGVKAAPHLKESRYVAAADIHRRARLLDEAPHRRSPAWSTSLVGPVSAPHATKVMRLQGRTSARSRVGSRASCPPGCAPRLRSDRADLRSLQ